MIAEIALGCEVAFEKLFESNFNFWNEKISLSLAYREVGFDLSDKRRFCFRIF